MTPVADWVGDDGVGYWGADPAPTGNDPTILQHWGGIQNTRDELFDTEHPHLEDPGVGTE